MKSKLQVLEQEITTQTKDGFEYICITDIARYKNPDPRYLNIADKLILSTLMKRTY